MPTYSYACTACGHAFDIHQSFSDESLTVCPECEGRLRKVFSSVGVVFKGSGFYRNDARSGTKSSSVPAAASSGSDSSSGSSSNGASTSGASTSSSNGSSGTSSNGSTAGSLTTSSSSGSSATPAKAASPAS
ncbi:FmdB family transcriptional regulator [Cellulomonas sp. DKR-3]|uniref:FmdB family transcriptional regulator n=1 Tax=Cellulomonas fulva TaxID=2835530 RepID=A0ABS5TUV9_9CELL|nr:FmdB family zinc ribbon protein [Cellulomonas fulva]MBT0992942.1 FmdB family transcriptional regulator [Cellulomonas fulva]